jgi:hypothetical protein
VQADQVFQGAKQSHFLPLPQTKRSLRAGLIDRKGEFQQGICTFHSFLLFLGRLDEAFEVDPSVAAQ